MNKADFLAQLELLAPHAIKAIQKAMKDGGPPALKAAEIWAQYLYGKPAQEVQVNGSLEHTGSALINITYVQSTHTDSKLIEHEPAPPAVGDSGYGSEG